MEQQLILDRYRPLEELGAGTFGTVLLAWDTRMQRRVAIKTLDIAVGLRGSGREPAGLSEARTAAMLNHPNIVTALDFDTDFDEAFIVMEYVDGASLAEVLDAADGRLEADEAASLLGDLTDALAFAHQNGVLHLDIKPENVLITRSGRAKIADFGIAELSTVYGHGSASGGTYGYMPAEQLEGGAVSARTDEWALAALLLEALTGDNPFAATAEKAKSRVENSDFIEVSSYSGLPRAADEVFRTALSVEPTERYLDVAAFADAIEPMLGDPDAGRLSLAELVEEIAGDEPQVDEAPAALGLWDRAGGRAGRALIGLAGAAQTAWLAWAGLAPFGLSSAPLAGAVSLGALAGFLAPPLGLALGLACLTAGLVAKGVWVAALLVPVIGGLWWWFFARRSGGAAVLPLSAPLFGAIRLPLAYPLICGFSLPPIEAAVTALLGGVLTFVASAASASPPPYSLIRLSYIADVWSKLPYTAVIDMSAAPATHVALLGWALAAAVMSVFSARATRGGALVGAVSGTIALGGAYMLADWVAGMTGSAQGFRSAEFAAVLVASLILVSVITALGAPVRGEDEAYVTPRLRDDGEDD